MRLHPRYLIAAALLLAAAGAASAGVTVTYEKPADFSDVPSMERDRDDLLKDITAHFGKLAQQLPAGQELKITITDIDLAGRVDPRRATAQDIRIVRGGADWPSMQLRYALEQDGKVISSGDERLANMMYQDRLSRYFSTDPLRYEKQMMDEWFKAKFGPAQLSKK